VLQSRSRIILAEQYPLLDASPTPAPNFMYSIGRFLKMSQSMAVLFLFTTISGIKNQYEAGTLFLWMDISCFILWQETCSGSGSSSDYFPKHLEKIEIFHGFKGIPVVSRKFHMLLLVSLDS
jgi:hypothetical protein